MHNSVTNSPCAPHKGNCRTARALGPSDFLPYATSLHLAGVAECPFLPRWENPGKSPQWVLYRHGAACAAALGLGLV